MKKIVSFLVISDMNIGLLQKLHLLALMVVDHSEVVVIDLYKNNDQPFIFKTALLKVGFFFKDLPTSKENPLHVCRLMISKSMESINRFEVANKNGDRETVQYMLGEGFTFPLSEGFVKSLQIESKMPFLFKELAQANLIKKEKMVA